MNYAKPIALLLALAWPAAVLAQGNDAAKPDAEVEIAVTKVVNEMSAALTKPDPEAAAKMLADSYYAVTPDGGTVGKAQFLAL
jgi:hypothetical protein